MHISAGSGVSLAHAVARSLLKCAWGLYRLLAFSLTRNRPLRYTVTYACSIVRSHLYGEIAEPVISHILRWGKWSKCIAVATL